MNVKEFHLIGWLQEAGAVLSMWVNDALAGQERTVEPGERTIHDWYEVIHEW